MNTLILAISGTARAAIVDVDICAKVDIDFDDNYVTAYDSLVLEDYLSDNSVNEPLRGVLLRVAETGNPSNYVQDFAEEGSVDPGCLVDVALDTTKTYTVTMYSSVTVNGQHVQMLDEVADPDVAIHVFTTALNPTVNLFKVNYVKTGAGHAWSVLTAVAWAFHHRDGGLPDMSWEVYPVVCPGVDAPCFDSGEDAMFLPDAVRVQATHNVAHNIQFRKHGSANVDYDADDDACWYADVEDRTHEMLSREFGSAAYQEGFAQFYSAVSYNDKNDGDCYLEYYKRQDYDFDTDGDPLTVNCEGVPWKLDNGSLIDTTDVTNSSLVGAGDFLYDSHIDLSCSAQSMANRATELDYFRFFWDLYAVEGMSLAEILDVIELSDPPSWDAGEDPEGATATDFPSVRMLEAVGDYDLAESTSWAGPWDDQADANGVWR
jgi:hypothetical protein